MYGTFLRNSNLFKKVNSFCHKQKKIISNSCLGCQYGHQMFSDPENSLFMTINFDTSVWKPSLTYNTIHGLKFLYTHTVIKRQPKRQIGLPKGIKESRKQYNLCFKESI